MREKMSFGRRWPLLIGLALIANLTACSDDRSPPDDGKDGKLLLQAISASKAMDCSLYQACLSMALEASALGTASSNIELGLDCDPSSGQEILDRLSAEAKRELAICLRTNDESKTN